MVILRLGLGPFRCFHSTYHGSKQNGVSATLRTPEYEIASFLFSIFSSDVPVQALDILGIINHVWITRNRPLLYVLYYHNVRTKLHKKW